MWHQGPKGHNAIYLSAILSATPPNVIPVEPAGIDDITIQDEKISETAQIHLGFYIVEIRVVFHVI
jgi:hypothetical protein